MTALSASQELEAAVIDAPERRPNVLTRLWRRLTRQRRELARAERRELDSQKRERDHQKRFEALLQMEAEICASALIGKLKDKGVRYEYKKRDGTGLARFKVVALMRPFVIREEAIYLKVDLRPGKSPPGVGVKELSNPEILPDLEIAVGHPVKTFYSAERGFMYIIERELGKRGIPNHVKFDDVLASRPASTDGLAIPLGVGADKKVAWRSLNRMYSLLIAGTTGAGKSNAINAMICTLLRFNSPRQLRLVLVDLKGGVEFTFFQDVPHLLPVPINEAGDKAAIIERREQVLPALEWLIKQGEDRLAKLKEKRAKNLGEYNQHWGPLPHIVLVIDEWADVKVEPKIGARAEELLVNVSNRFRAAGIHVILCTQSPTKEVVSLRIKNAMPAKLAFSMSNVYASMMVVGNGGAYGLEPEGRAIFDWNQAQFEIQTPLINNDMVDSMVAQAIRGEWDDTPPQAHDVTDAEIFLWAVEHQDGFLVGEEVYSKFRGRGMSQAYAKEFCQRAQGQKVMVSSTPYTVMPPARANQGRRLLPTAVVEELANAVPGVKEKPPAVTRQMVVEWAVAENECRLQKSAVWEQFRERGLSNKGAADLCKGLEGEVVSVGGREYRVLPAVQRPGRGALPRRLEVLGGETPGETAAIPPAVTVSAEVVLPEPPGVPTLEAPEEIQAARTDGGAVGPSPVAHVVETIAGPETSQPLARIGPEAIGVMTP